MARSPARSHRERLLAVLAHHGLAALPAEAVIRLGPTLRAETLHHRREFAAFVDAQSGLQLGPTAAGRADEVDLGPLIRIREPGRTYVCLHTHPQSMPLSVEDVALLLEEAFVCVVAAVGRDGSWYLMSVEPNQPRPDIEAMWREFGEIAEATLARYSVSVDARPGEVKASRRAHMHEIWTLAAPILGLRYDRVEGGGRS